MSPSLHLPFRRGQQRVHRQAIDVLEDGVLGDQSPFEVQCRCSDPSICFVNLLTESQASALAASAKISACSHQVVVGLDDDKPSERPLEAAPPELSPACLHRAVAQSP